nr:Uncharacterised protein [Providencia rettgeri]
MVWDDDLDKKVKERLIPGIQYWNNYSAEFQKTLSKTDKKEMKVDFVLNMAVYMKLHQ